MLSLWLGFGLLLLCLIVWWLMIWGLWLFGCGFGQGMCIYFDEVPQGTSWCRYLLCFYYVCGLECLVFLASLGF